VATSATAILSDIYLSNCLRPAGAFNSDPNPQKPRIARKFLTARVNQTLSTPVLGPLPPLQQRKCSKQSK
jgi:hypothetical protein